MLSGDACIATAETLEETEVAYIDREQFVLTLLHNPEAALSVAVQACANYKSACRQISLLALCRSASERLAQFILNWSAPKVFRDSQPVWPGSDTRGNFASRRYHSRNRNPYVDGFPPQRLGILGIFPAGDPESRALEKLVA